MRNSLTLSEDETKKLLDDKTPYVIRMQIPEGNVVRFTDDIRGTVEFHGLEIDDQVLMKSDGFPTYHLAHVVDDHLMDISLVIRGEEWLSSTPKHLLLYEFLGWNAPRYAHVPLLLNKDKSKLSKRQCDVSAEEYIKKGYLPETLLNFLALLGWNPGGTQELFTLDELIDVFSLDRVQKGGAIFDCEKLDWLQGQWIRKIEPDAFAEKIRPFVSEKYADAENDPDFVKKASLIQERITFFPEAPEMLSFFYEEPKVDFDLLINEKQKVTKDDLPAIMDALIETMENIDDWSEENLKEVLFALVDKKGWKKGQVLWPLRATLTGLAYSPGAFEVAAVIGKEASLKRLTEAKKSCA